jgi:hypothetical protein
LEFVKKGNFDMGEYYGAERSTIDNTQWKGKSSTSISTQKK